MTARRLAVGALLSVSLAAPPAHAHVPPPSLWPTLQDPRPEPARSEAARAFAAGEAAFDAGDFETAVEHFARAQALMPHPHTAYNLGLAQARAGQLLEAWATFSTLRDEASDPQRRTEAELQLARLAPSVARIRVHASQGQVIEVDGQRLEPGEVLTRPPGPAQVRVGAQRLEVDLVGGELRALDVRTLQAPPRRGPPRRGRVALLAATVGFSAGTAGTATAAALVDDGTRRPLGFAAAGLGAATLVLAATALGMHLRDRKNAAPRSDR